MHIIYNPLFATILQKLGIWHYSDSADLRAPATKEQRNNGGVVDFEVLKYQADRINQTTTKMISTPKMETSENPWSSKVLTGGGMADSCENSQEAVYFSEITTMFEILWWWRVEKFGKIFWYPVIITLILYSPILSIHKYIYILYLFSNVWICMVNYIGKLQKVSCPSISG